MALPLFLLDPNSTPLCPLSSRSLRKGNTNTTPQMLRLGRDPTVVVQAFPPRPAGTI